MQESHAWLKQTYAALDEQAAQTGQESIDRYLLNNALLGQVFSGPGPLPELLGGAGTYMMAAVLARSCRDVHFRSMLMAAMHADGRTSVTELAARLGPAAGRDGDEDAAAQSLPEQPAEKDAARANLEVRHPGRFHSV